MRIVPNKLLIPAAQARKHYASLGLREVARRLTIVPPTSRGSEWNLTTPRQTASVERRFLEKICGVADRQKTEDDDHVTIAAESATPSFIKRWRKTITPGSGGSDADERAHGENLAVEIWIAEVGAFRRSRGSPDVLTDDDRSALTQLKTPAARNCATAARILLRLGLSQIVKGRIAPHEWRFRRSADGKPMLLHPGETIHFSVSHTDAAVAVAVSSSLELGIDVESLDQDLADDVIDNFCSERERRILCACSPTERTREFIKLWTRKEAYAKLLGRGHAIDFSSLECADNPSGPPEDDCWCSAVQFESFNVPVDHSLHYGSLAVKRPYAQSVDIQLINVVGSESGAADSSAAGFR